MRTHPSFPTCNTATIFWCVAALSRKKRYNLNYWPVGEVEREDEESSEDVAMTGLRSLGSLGTCESLGELGGAYDSLRAAGGSRKGLGEWASLGERGSLGNCGGRSR